MEQAQHERARVEAALAAANQQLQDAQGLASSMAHTQFGYTFIQFHMCLFFFCPERERNLSQQLVSKESALESSARSLKTAEAQLQESRTKCQQVTHRTHLLSSLPRCVHI